MKKLLSTRYTYCKDYLEKIIINENDSEHYYKMIKERCQRKNMVHERFHYKTLEELKNKAAELQIHLPFAENTQILAKELTFGNVTL